jgi:hypothetical protein
MRLTTLLFASVALASGQQEPGRPIGTVTARGDLIVLKLDEGTLPKANLFDLARRTLRFTPDGSAYRAENQSLQWDPEFGSELTGPQVTLSNFAFPYSGKSWNAFTVGTTGTISFGGPSAGGRGGRGGFSIGRFDQLRLAAGTLINTVPAISVFLKPRMTGTRHVKELADRVVITWNLTEPFAGIQDFTWVPTVNRSRPCSGAMDRSICPTIRLPPATQLSASIPPSRPPPNGRSPPFSTRRMPRSPRISISGA